MPLGNKATLVSMFNEKANALNREASESVNATWMPSVNTFRASTLKPIKASGEIFRMPLVTGDAILAS